MYFGEEETLFLYASVFVMEFSRILMGFSFRGGLKFIRTYAHTLALALQKCLLGEKFI